MNRPDLLFGIVSWLFVTIALFAKTAPVIADPTGFVIATTVVWLPIMFVYKLATMDDPNKEKKKKKEKWGEDIYGLTNHDILERCAYKDAEWCERAFDYAQHELYDEKWERKRFKEKMEVFRKL